MANGECLFMIPNILLVKFNVNGFYEGLSRATTRCLVIKEDSSIILSTDIDNTLTQIASFVDARKKIHSRILMVDLPLKGM